jgi:hypothetical protein
MWYICYINSVHTTARTALPAQSPSAGARCTAPPDRSPQSRSLRPAPRDAVIYFANGRDGHEKIGTILPIYGNMMMDLKVFQYSPNFWNLKNIWISVHMCSDFKNAQVGWQTANPNSTVRVQFRMKLVAQSPYKDQRWTHKTGFARNWDCIANAVKGCSVDIPNANDPTLWVAIIYTYIYIYNHWTNMSHRQAASGGSLQHQNRDLAGGELP